MLKYLHIKTNPAKGTSVIELLVVIAIIFILAATVFLNYPEGKKEFNLRKSGHKLAQDLRRGEEMAMSARKKAGICQSPGATGITGYGLYFDETTATQYILFINCDANTAYDAGIDDVIETVDLDDLGIKIKNLKKGINEPDTLTVVFKPPDPTVYINNDDTSCVGEIIICRIDAETQTKTVKINDIGMIKIEE